MAPLGETPERFPGHSYPQVIPRPGDRQPGRRAPWADLARARRRGLTTERVVARLRRAGRTLDEAAPARAPAVGADAAAAGPAAVLVILFDLAGESRVVLTRRAATMRSHRGEVSFPGGRGEPGEAVVATALREAREEVGDDVGAATPVARLSPLESFASGRAIWPVVATLERPPVLRGNPAEVERAFSVALADLLAEGAYVEERWRRPGADPSSGDGYVSVAFFKVPGDVVWGATARMLVELCCLATGLAWPLARGRAHSGG